MTKFAQILSVVVAVFTLLFLATMVVVSTGGPNWRAIADDIEDYAFDPIPGDGVTRWAVTHRVTGTAVQTTNTLPGAIVAALQDRATRLDLRIEATESQLEGVRTQSDRVDEFRGIDEPGIARGVELVREQIAGIAEETVRLTSEGTGVAESAATARRTVDRRRADVARLDSQLSEVRAQRAAYELQNERLLDRLTRIRGELGRATARRDSLAAEAAF